MIHPTRTNLLLLKEKKRSVINSIGLLKARRQSLIQEFFNTTGPFVRSREAIKKLYGTALDDLSISLGHEGESVIDSIGCTAQRDIGVDIIERSIWGLKYKDIILNEAPVRKPEERGYDFLLSTPYLEESIHLFEQVLESMIEIASFENKLKRLGDEILKIMQKIRLLEERALPNLKEQIKFISQHINERERESYYRLKKFKS